MMISEMHKVPVQGVVAHHLAGVKEHIEVRHIGGNAQEKRPRIAEPFASNAQCDRRAQKAVGNGIHAAGL